MTLLQPLDFPVDFVPSRPRVNPEDLGEIMRMITCSGPFPKAQIALNMKRLPLGRVDPPIQRKTHINAVEKYVSRLVETKPVCRLE
jgi:hypothetical protein